MRWSMRRRVLTALLLLLGAVAAWLLVTDDARIWPYRNALQYYLLRRWLPDVAAAPAGSAGVLAGTLRDQRAAPIPNGRVLISAWNGTTWSAETDTEGRYRIPDVPAGRHVAVAGAVGYENGTTRSLLL